MITLCYKHFLKTAAESNKLCGHEAIIIHLSAKHMGAYATACVRINTLHGVSVVRIHVHTHIMSSHTSHYLNTEIYMKTDVLAIITVCKWFLTG